MSNRNVVNLAGLSQRRMDMGTMAWSHVMGGVKIFVKL